MGVASAQDTFQKIVYNFFGDLNFALVYIDNILILERKDKTEDNHLAKIEKVLERLESCFCANLKKSIFMQEEIKYLGFLLTKDAIKNHSPRKRR